MTETPTAIEIVSESLLKMFNNSFKLGPKFYLIKGKRIIREPSIRRVNERKATISFEMFVPSASPMGSGGEITHILRAIHKLSLTAKEYLKPIEITMTPTKEGFECLVSITARKSS